MIVRAFVFSSFIGFSLFAAEPTNVIVDVSVDVPNRQQCLVEIENQEDAEILCRTSVKASVFVNDVEVRQITLGTRLSIQAGKVGTSKLGKERLEAIGTPGVYYKNGTLIENKCEFFDSTIPPGACTREDLVFSTEEGGCKDGITKMVWSAVSDKRLVFADAKKYCEDLVEGGQNDWFMPTQERLRTIDPFKLKTTYFHLPPGIIPDKFKAGASFADGVMLLVRNNETEDFAGSGVVGGEPEVALYSFFADKIMGLTVPQNQKAHVICYRKGN